MKEILFEEIIPKLDFPYDLIPIHKIEEEFQEQGYHIEYVLLYNLLHQLEKEQEIDIMKCIYIRD